MLIPKLLSSKPFAFIILIVILTGCSMLESQKDCRDDLVEKVPIYPNARLILEERDSTSDNPNIGTLDRVYETSDSVDDVRSFYTPLMGCSPFTPPCFGSATGDDRLWYSIRVLENNDTVTFSIGFDWACGRGQFPDP